MRVFCGPQKPLQRYFSAKIQRQGTVKFTVDQDSFELDAQGGSVGRFCPQ
jgi:hypothetical protein